MLKLLHRHPIWSTGVLFAIGLGVILWTMVNLSQRMSEEMAEQHAMLAGLDDQEPLCIGIGIHLG